MTYGFLPTSNRRNLAQIRAWLATPCSASVLLLVIASGHLSGMFTYGATFWVDSTAYVYFAQMFTSMETAKTILLNPDFLMYSHIGWGEPFLWYLLTRLPLDWAWPVMAAGKHLLGVMALLHLFTTANRIFPSRIHPVFAAIISFLPFYQAMHNMLLTESVSTNCILIVLASSMRIYFNCDEIPMDRQSTNISAFAWLKRHKTWILFTVFSCMAVQFRSMTIIFPFAFIVVLWSNRFSWRRTLSLGFVFGIIFLSTLAFTLYRYHVTGKFVTSSPWGNSIVLGQNITRSTSDKVVEYAETLQWPDREEYLAKIQQGGIRVQDQKRLITYWHSLGFSPSDMQHMSDSLKKRYLDEPGIALPVRRLFAGFSTLGFAIHLKLVPDEYVPLRGENGTEYYKKFLHWYRYFSWFRPNKGEFEKLSSIAFDHTPAHEYYFATLKPYLKFDPNRIINNPFKLGRIAPDFWFAIGVISALWLLTKREWIAGFLLLPMVFNCIAIYYIPVAGVRYCYVFIPFYILFSSIALAGATANFD